jgi:hypothetical protein
LTKEKVISVIMVFFKSSKFFVLVTLLLSTPSFGQTIVDIISRDIRFSTFVSLLTAADLTTDLRGPGRCIFCIFVSLSAAMTEPGKFQWIQILWYWFHSLTVSSETLLIRPVYSVCSF